MSIATNESFFVTVKKNFDEAFGNTDPRVKNYPLVGNDPTVLCLVIFYLLFVILGKRFMEHRKAVNVPVPVLFVYNFGLVIMSAYMLEEVVVGVYQSQYDFFCGRIMNTPAEMKVVNGLWWYFFSKAIELLDTVWMVIRKKNDQITFLHVFHHSTMLLIWWIVVTWIPAGQSFVGVSLNCCVHVFMYAYYALSAIPSLREKLWWKKYITTFQLVQFMIALVHGLYGMATGCTFPMWGQLLIVGYMIIMLVLFSNFYVHEYIKKSNAAKKRKQQQAEEKQLRKGVDLNNNDVVTSDKKKKAN